jgi:hypothetical protein
VSNFGGGLHPLAFTDHERARLMQICDLLRIMSEADASFLEKIVTGWRFRGERDDLESTG